MPKAVLQGLKHEDIEISAICAMLDTGGSSGRLRSDYGILSPGDIRRAFIALANTSPVIEELFNYRFEAGELQGHNFANLFIAALELSSNDREKTIEAMNEILKVSHKVFPATMEDSELCAELEDGTMVRGETNIDKPKHDGGKKIKKVFLDPPAKGYPRALDAIKEGSLIVIGPGDLYSSLAQVLLTENLSEAICRRKGKVAYVCNLMTKYGETNEFSVEDFTEKTEEFVGCPIDYVIYNTKIPAKKDIARFKKEHPELLDIVRPEKELDKKKFIGTDLLKGERLVHDAKKMTDIIISLL